MKILLVGEDVNPNEPDNSGLTPLSRLVAMDTGGSFKYYENRVEGC